MPQSATTTPLFAVLGLSTDATQADIRAAFRRAAHRWHPDRNPGIPSAAASFVEAQQAYRILSGKRAAPPAKPTPPTARVPPRKPDVFGDDIHRTLVLTLPSLFAPQQCVMDIRHAVACQFCKGLRPGCRYCAARGQIFMTSRLALRLPPGLLPGQCLVFRGRGHDGPLFSAPGNLIVTVAWKRSGRWQWNPVTLRLETVLRRGHRIRAHGGKARLRAPTGSRLDIEVPPRLPEGSWLRLAGVGLPATTAPHQCADAFVCLA